MQYKNTFCIITLLFLAVGCWAKVRVGADHIEQLCHELGSRRVALVINNTSVLSDGHLLLLDTLLRRGVRVVKVFTPEHGFRGNHDAAAPVRNSIDHDTGIPIISLFGDIVKPTALQLADVDVIVYDLQDVGLRFYTYISTLHYVMESCAETHTPLIVLDRPNPNDYIDGPMMEEECKSFIGVDCIPMLYGMTVGELAQMINGERWLKTKPNTCKLRVIKVDGWHHGQPYALPVRPSPNLPNSQSVHLYASICILGPTMCSVGRGTPWPFQVIGYPDSTMGEFSFVPQSKPGEASHPIYEGIKCYGIDLRKDSFHGGLTLRYLLHFYNQSGRNKDFVKDTIWFSHLVGTFALWRQMRQGLNEQQIRATWEPQLLRFKSRRKRYLLYKGNRG